MKLIKLMFPFALMMALTLSGCGVSNEVISETLIKNGYSNITLLDGGIFAAPALCNLGGYYMNALATNSQGKEVHVLVCCDLGGNCFIKRSI